MLFLLLGFAYLFKSPDSLFYRFAHRKVKNAIINRYSFSAYTDFNIICNRRYICKFTHSTRNRFGCHYALFERHLSERRCICVCFGFLLFPHSSYSGYCGGFVLVIVRNIFLCFINRFFGSCRICRDSINYAFTYIFVFFFKRLFQSVEMVKHTIKTYPRVAVLVRLYECKIHRSNFLLILKAVHGFIRTVAFSFVIPVRQRLIVPCSHIDSAFQYICLLVLTYSLFYYLFVLYLTAFPYSDAFLLFERCLRFVKSSLCIDCRTYCRRCTDCRRNCFTKFHILPTSRSLPKLLFNAL